ncbi:YlxM family DNA-binding protein [Desulfoscipio sp. XC116]|uniref:YlxM family DNA-binding protein n=1 Tax=Desulfoscipio sp. XC116 TaxID=3144975 RepID=UPI00325B0B16
MDKVIRMTLLYDFYGPLLTERQQKFIELYYGNDYSLGEIAENYGVSRQAVHDTLKRAESVLANYETKLKLIDKFLMQRNKLAEVARLLEESQEPSFQQLARAREVLQELLEMDRG